MSVDELQELQDAVAYIALRDVHLGRVLDLLVLHVAHAHGLDPAAEAAKAQEQTAPALEGV
jgi:hypothetical protein